MSTNKKSPSKRRSHKSKQDDEASDALLGQSSHDIDDDHDHDHDASSNLAPAERTTTSWQHHLAPPSSQHLPQQTFPTPPRIPLIHSRSSPLHHHHPFTTSQHAQPPAPPPQYYIQHYGCYQFTPGLAWAHHPTSTHTQEEEEFIPAPLTRTHSTPEPYGPLRHRACSAFGNFRSFRTPGGSDGGMMMLLHQHSDPGFSAFCPVEGMGNDRRPLGDGAAELALAVGKPSSSLFGREKGEEEESPSTSLEGGRKKTSPPCLLGSKLLSNIRGMGWKNRGRRKVSGRENPVSLLAEEGEDNEVMASSGGGGGGGDEGGQGRRMMGQLEEGSQFGGGIPGPLPRGVSERSLRTTSVDMYSDSDLDDDIMEPIVGQYHLLDEEQHQEQYPRPPSADLPSVEVVAEGSFPRLLSLDASHDNVVLTELRTPVSLKVAPLADNLAHLRCEDILESEESPAYHPLLDHEEDDDDDEERDEQARHEKPNVSTKISGFPLQLSYKSPEPNASPDTSNKSSNHNHHSPSSHDSRLSGSNSRTTNSGHTDSSQADYEVRQANRRRPSIQRNREEVVVDLDGNATVHSSSTSSSNYHVHSPKMREGACLPVERFFAGGNVVLTPRRTTGVNGDGSAGGGEGDELAEMNISKFLALSPKKSMRNRDGGAHSPHTVSSASVSNTSSSGSETKKPLKFVAYKERMESPTKSIVDCSRLTLEENDEHSTSTPVTKRTIGAMIKPRISTGAGQRPPIQPFPPYQKPPQSPRKDSIRGSGTRTPTRTPPPAREYGSGASTPSSPPVIVDGPNVMRGDWKYREGTKKPYVVRGTHSGLRLLPPSSELLYRHAPRERGPLDDSITVTVDDGANNGAHEVFTASLVPKDAAYALPVKTISAAVVTPDKPVKRKVKKNAQDCKKMQNLAMVSPDKRG